MCLMTVFVQKLSMKIGRIKTMLINLFVSSIMMWCFYYFLNQLSSNIPLLIVYQVIRISIADCNYPLGIIHLAIKIILEESLMMDAVKPNQRGTFHLIFRFLEKRRKCEQYRLVWKFLRWRTVV